MATARHAGARPVAHPPEAARVGPARQPRAVVELEPAGQANTGAAENGGSAICGGRHGHDAAGGCGCRAAAIKQSERASTLHTCTCETVVTIKKLRRRSRESPLAVWRLVLVYNVTHVARCGVSWEKNANRSFYVNTITLFFFSHTKPLAGNRQPASSIFLSQQISTSHQS